MVAMMVTKPPHANSPFKYRQSTNFSIDPWCNVYNIFFKGLWRPC